MNLFGKELFTYKKPAESMYDFAQFGILNDERAFDYALDVPLAELRATTKEKREKPSVKPRDLHEMKSLNENDFKINVNSDYLDEKISELKDKLGFLGEKPKKKRGKEEIFTLGENGAIKFGREELESVVLRLENRRKLLTFSKVVDRYPHTTSQLIAKVISEHSNLRCDKAEQFVPEFPANAVTAMKEYSRMCEDLCGKRAVFYVIADRKDFEKVPARRDPILLAQSPFGHFWQILGAWDDEMIYLGDL